MKRSELQSNMKVFEHKRNYKPTIIHDNKWLFHIYVRGSTQNSDVIRVCMRRGGIKNQTKDDKTLKKKCIYTQETTLSINKQA